jgi:hypothetical protein
MDLPRCPTLCVLKDKNITKKQTSHYICRAWLDFRSGHVCDHGIVEFVSYKLVHDASKPEHQSKTAGQQGNATDLASFCSCQELESANTGQGIWCIKTNPQRTLIQMLLLPCCMFCQQIVFPMSTTQTLDLFPSSEHILSHYISTSEQQSTHSA